MLGYHRECDPDQVLSYDWCHSFNPFACCWNLLSGFSRAPDGFKPYLLDFDIENLLKPPRWIPMMCLAPDKSIYGTKHLKSVLDIHRACEQSSRACILWCISSVINEGKAHMIAPLLNSRHTSVGPHWVNVCRNSIVPHGHYESTLHAGTQCVPAPLPKKKERKKESGVPLPEKEKLCSCLCIFLYTISHHLHSLLIIIISSKWFFKCDIYNRKSKLVFKLFSLGLIMFVLPHLSGSCTYVGGINPQMPLQSVEGH